jgi:cell division protein FtsB
VREGNRAKAKRVALSVVILSTVVLFSSWFAAGTVNRQLVDISAQAQGLASELTQVRSALQQAQQQVANLSTGSQVDRKAVDDLRIVVKDQQQEIADLTEEISFYKGLMAPTDREKGLSIRGWEVYATADPQRFQYKLLMQQLAVKHQLLHGSVSVVIVGRKGEQEQSFNLADVTDAVNSPKLPLRFKYFQNMDGELVLPVGFEPLRVDVVATATKPASAKVEKHYGWIAQKD